MQIIKEYGFSRVKQTKIDILYVNYTYNLFSLLQEERLRTTMSFYRRTKEELMEAFSDESAVTAAGLTLVSQEFVTVPCEFLYELKQAEPHEIGIV